MIPTHLYNDNDKNITSWLRQLIDMSCIPQGDVTEKSILDVGADELSGYTQCHFFAGIGGWPYALKLAGWPDSAPIWTGSCPCQPFSTAGKGKGEADERHLWPEFKRLIEQCLPSVVVGEQVASKAGREWFNGVRVDLEAMGYAVGATDLCAAGIGSPHIRQRLFWVGIRPGYSELGDAIRERCSGEYLLIREKQNNTVEVGGAGTFGGVEIPESLRCERSGEETGCSPEASSQLRHSGVAHTQHARPCGEERDSTVTHSNGKDGGLYNRSIAHAWDEYDFVYCRDNKVRRIESGTFPLVDGLPKGMVPSGDISLSYVENTKEAYGMRLKGYGNAIVPQLAAVFIESVMDVICGIY